MKLPKWLMWNPSKYEPEPKLDLPWEKINKAELRLATGWVDTGKKVRLVK